MSDSVKITEETVREMAKLALVSNRINDIQAKSLKTYAFIFNGVKSAKVDYDLSNNTLVDFEKNEKELDVTYKFKPVNTAHHRVTYKLTMDETVENDHLDKRFEAIERAVRTLLWTEIKVLVYFNDKLAYESKK